MRRASIFIYGLLSYAIFFATILYAFGFVGNILVPKSMDSPADGPLLQAILIDIGLLGLFAFQHSLMARPGFKKWWTRYVPQEAERSTYVLFSSVLMIAVFVFWHPLGGTVWHVEHPVAQAVLYGLFGFGWLLVLVSTFLIDHFDLFGLRQVWLCLRGREYMPVEFTMPGPYRVVRHPLYAGWLLAFWATPTMTATHLVFALTTTVYILVAIRLEEKDLLDAHPEYAVYRREVPALVPRLSGRGAGPDDAVAASETTHAR